MNQPWPITRLGDLAILVTKGTTPTSIGHGFVPEGINFVKVESIATTGEFIDEKFAHITSECHAALRRSQLQGGDILFSIAGALGRTAYVTDDILPANTNQALAIIRLKPDAAVLTEFVRKALETGVVLEQIEQFRGGAAQQNLSLAQVRDFHIGLPPLTEQKRIIGLLDEAFAGIATAKANAEKNFRNARALLESHLQSVFSERGERWAEKTLECCCEQIFAGGDVPKDRLSQERTPKYNVPIFSNGEKNDGLYGFTDVARVTKPSITVSARGTLGFTAIRTEAFLPVVRLIVLVPDEKSVTLSFLYYAVLGMEFGNTGTSIPQLTVPNFKESKLYLPSIPEQKSIVAKLNALREETQRLATIYERKLAALDALKNSILYQAFSGNL